jgi:hypothetical protein
MTELSKTERLASALLADRNRQTTQHNIIGCFVCGYRFVYKGRWGELNGNFCSIRCQDWYDAGNEPVSDEIVYCWREGRPMRAGSKGCYIDCANCRKEFESLGLRCCSTECDQGHRERESNLAVMAEAGIEPKARRQCEQCKAVIPTWRKGRKISKSVRFCSEKCSKRAKRAAA